MFFHKPSMTSTHDSAESIATPPPKSDLDDDELRNMLASPLYLQEREAIAECPVHLTSKKVLGNLPQCSHKPRKSSQDPFANGEGISSGHQSVQRKGETFFRFSDPEEAARTFLKNKEIIYSQKQNPKSSSKNVKLTLLTLAFMNFNDKLTLLYRSSLHKHKSCRKE